MMKIFQIHKIYRCYSIKRATTEPIKYTNTINLPKTKFPNRLSAAKREELENKLIEGPFAFAYRYQEHNKEEPAFVLHDGPPYANGDLHMGHAVNKILKDITLRHHVAKGRKIQFVPGWDCHGLPIELKALSAISKDSRHQDAKAIREKSRQFAMNAVLKQREEFRSWGILADWYNSDNIYITNSPDFIINQLKLFLDLYQRGLIYRDLKPVFWSPSSHTALAEAELEYDPNYESPSVYVRFKLNVPPKILSPSLLNRTIYALVWTTTPWTLPSNQAICYNPDLQYSIVKLSGVNSSASNELYIIATNLLADLKTTAQIDCQTLQTINGSDLVDCKYAHPIDGTQQMLSFFPAPHVQDTKGTGLVHTAPAHGSEDFLVSLSEKLPVISYVDENGTYTKDAPSFLRGKDVLSEGNDLVLNHISSDVTFSGKINHSYPIDWRTKKPIIIRASEQWFIDTKKLKKRAVEEISKIEVFPRVNASASINLLSNQIEKRPYWCISRQRAWGVPIPAFFNCKTSEVLTNKKIIDHICDLIAIEGNIDFWWSQSVEEILPTALLREFNLSASDLMKGNDIFDIWFDSGSSWLSALKNEKVADLYLEGADQFTGWFQSSLLTSIAARDCAPYRSLFVHGFTVDQKGFKMSKSLGNVISPTDVRKKFGVDALRWWVASHGPQNMSITVSDHLLQQAAESVTKVRSVLRYLNGVIGQKSDMAKQDTNRQIYLNKYLLSSLLDFERDIQNYNDAYEYNRVIAHIQNFIANHISATYVHLIKDRLYCGDQDDIRSIQFTLARCYEVICKLLWPITPFLVEESWSYYDEDHAFYQENIKTDQSWRNEEAENVLKCALNVKRLINQSTENKNTWTIDVELTIKNNDDFNRISKLHPQSNVSLTNTELCEILQVGSIKIIHADKYNSNEDFVISLKNIEAKICPRCRRFSVQNADSICERCTNVLKANH